MRTKEKKKTIKETRSESGFFFLFGNTFVCLFFAEDLNLELFLMANVH